MWSRWGQLCVRRVVQRRRRRCVSKYACEFYCEWCAFIKWFWRNYAYASSLLSLGREWRIVGMALRISNIAIRTSVSFFLLALAVFLIFCGVYEGYLVGWNLGLLVLLLFFLGFLVALLLLNVKTIAIQSLLALATAFLITHLFLYSIPEFIYPDCPRSLDRCGQLIGFSIAPYIVGVGLGLLVRASYFRLRNWRKGS